MGNPMKGREKDRFSFVLHRFIRWGLWRSDVCGDWSNPSHEKSYKRLTEIKKVLKHLRL